MGVAVKWDNEQHTTLLYTFTDPWDWGDYDLAAHLGRKMMDDSPHKVAIIIDLIGTQNLARGAIQRLSQGIEKVHPNRGTIVIVCTNPFVQAIMSILTRLYPEHARDVHNVKTLEQARALASRQPWIRGLFGNLRD